MIQNNEWDLVLTDIRMPGMDGLSLLSRVQADHPDLSVVIITGHGNMDTAVQALRVGAADFLTKPIKLLELNAVLEKAVRLQGLRRKKRLLRETVGRIQTSVGNRSLIGAGTAIKQVADQIQKAVDAACDTILIRCTDSASIQFISLRCGTGRKTSSRRQRIFSPFTRPAGVFNSIHSQKTCKRCC
ncbi:MAG: response regulator [Gemmatimonadota bacterium]|nr:response regulator [Gemmatimonadota bacterium]